jgi:hypothetical protein
MPTVTIGDEFTTQAERIAREPALAFVTRMRRVAATAPAGGARLSVLFVGGFQASSAPKASHGRAARRNSARRR